MTDTSKNVAFIGIGKMGLPMSVLLAKAGYAVTAFDQSAARIDLCGYVLNYTVCVLLRVVLLVFLRVGDVMKWRQSIGLDKPLQAGEVEVNQAIGRPDVGQMSPVLGKAPNKLLFRWNWHC